LTYPSITSVLDGIYLSPLCESFAVVSVASFLSLSCKNFPISIYHLSCFSRFLVCRFRFWISLPVPLRRFQHAHVPLAIHLRFFLPKRKIFRRFARRRELPFLFPLDRVVILVFPGFRDPDAHIVFLPLEGLASENQTPSPYRRLLSSSVCAVLTEQAWVIELFLSFQTLLTSVLRGNMIVFNRDGNISSSSFSAIARPLFLCSLPFTLPYRTEGSI